MTDILQQLPGALSGWYEKNKRALPWREDTHPYHIWLSEIMLQQTRVEAVKGYYTRFLQALPTIGALADADEAVLLKLWEGLGYYSRVRNLQKAARIIQTDYVGIFPREYAAVRALPGIGDYTAGAICSIAFGQPTPAVDGNVLRLISRLTADATPIDLPARKDQVRQALQAVYPPEAGVFTQALMELGATVCGPNREPDCAACPCTAFCLGYRQQIAASLPVRLPKKPRKSRSLTVFILRCDDRFALQKRPKQGLLAGMWQFPEAEGTLEASQALEVLASMGLQVLDIRRQTDKIHIFTHIQWQMRGFYLDVAQPAGDFTWLTAQQIRQGAAIPTAYRQFWEDSV